MMHYIVRTWLPKMRKYIPVKVEADNEKEATRLVRKRGYTKILYIKEIKLKKLDND